MNLEKLSKDDIILAYQALEVSAKAEIERLTIENAGLRARLKKAVELPCKLGDEIYTIDRLGKIHLFYAEEICVDESGEFLYYTPTVPEEQLVFGREVFTTYEAAEARLKELKGGRGNADNRS